MELNLRVPPRLHEGGTIDDSSLKWPRQYTGVLYYNSTQYTVYSCTVLPVLQQYTVHRCTVLPVLQQYTVYRCTVLQSICISSTQACPIIIRLCGFIYNNIRSDTLCVIQLTTLYTYSSQHYINTANNIIQIQLTIS